ncbi:Putative Heat shock protein 9/12 [Septoria linicola]|uniref:Heat shock protein 9/12 n=1 Tax=Septoria linicola TaxID=215465 RepID=A0A9Q9EDV4_9PEZI|nr:putative Heat shock protein 9/12 [Septoria linicola]USW47205.1 Putative Heat shock protein 9/12 [Septoria linicola]
MSDSLRQDTTDKVASAVKPDSQKSTTESLGDKAKGTGDSVAGKAQPEGEKSTFQQASDGASNAAGQAKDALGLGDKK